VVQLIHINNVGHTGEIMGKAYLIPQTEGEYLKERISKIGDVINVYHTAGAIILGFSGSAVINLFTSDFPKSQDGGNSARFVICLAIAVCTLVVGGMAFLLGKKQRDLQSVKSEDVIKQMQVIEDRYSS
jgi:hypothetical protein